jgi:hypothetical protein
MAEEEEKRRKQNPPPESRPRGTLTRAGD